MPLPLAAIAAGTQVAQGIANPLMAHFTNVKNRKFAREQYKTQRKDALADWEMQNAYNSPAAQMERFKQAGLNPHLIYGQSNEGATVRSSGFSGGGAQAPATNIGGAVGEYQRIRQSEAQTDLTNRVVSQQMEDQHNKTLAEIIQIMSNTDRTKLDIEGIKLDNQLKMRLQDTTVAQAQATLRKTEVDTRYTLDQNDRAAAQNVQSLAEGAERILLSKAHRGQIKISNDKLKEEIANLKKDGKLKDFDVSLTEKGIRPGDPVWYRALGIIINKIMTKFGLIPGEKLEDLPSEEIHKRLKLKAPVGKHQ